MSLFASLDVANPLQSQSGALIAPVKRVNLGCNTGNSTHLQNTTTQAQMGLGRKPKRSKTKRVRKNKRTRKSGKSGKSGKRKYKRTMNRRRKRSRMSHSGKKRSKGSRKNKRVRVNQVGRGTSYENVLTPMVGMGPLGARTEVAPVRTGAFADLS